MDTSMIARRSVDKVRIGLVDSIRGLAVFGILWVNIFLRSDPIQRNALPQEADWLNWFVAFSGNYKFRSMFAFLFGFGMAMQARRAIDDRAFVRTYLRRLAVLLLIGLTHIVMLWPGDILALYALCGMLLIWIRNANMKALFVLAMALLSVPVLQELAGVRLFDPASLKSDIVSGYAIYQNGTFWQITARRVYDFQSFWAPSLAASCPRVLAMMLLGIMFERRSYIERRDEHLGFWRRLCFWGLVFGLPANAIYASWRVSAAPSQTLSLIAKCSHAYGAPLLCMAYIAIAVLLSRKHSWQRALHVLAPIGRMSLTSYLGHSIVGSVLFYSYGLGWFGHLKQWQDVAVAFGLCMLQLAFANVWFTQFKMGPFEWIWRWMTYGTRPALRRYEMSPASASGH